MASASKRWLMETNIPKLIQAEITSFTDTSIKEAKSEAEINSVTFNTFASSSSAIIRASSASARPLRFSRRLSAPKLCLLVAPCKRAIVALICSWMSLSDNSPFGAGLAPGAGFLLKSFLSPGRPPPVPGTDGAGFFSSLMIRLRLCFALFPRSPAAGKSILPKTVKPFKVSPRASIN